MTDRLAEIAARLRACARCPTMYGFDAELMNEAAAHIESQAEQIAKACELLDTSDGLHIPDELPLVEKVADRLRFQAEQIARLEGERDAAITEHGKESGFWGRMAAKAVQDRKKVEQRLARLEGALKAWKDALETCPDSITIEQAQADLFALAATPEAT